jgi:hypothetical protein
MEAALLGAIVIVLMAFLGCIIGCVDYCWAPQGEKYPPKCQGPRSCGDFFLAVVGIMMKGAFILLVSEPMLTTICEDIFGFMMNLFFLGGMGALMFTIYLPITCSRRRCPTMKEVAQQFRAEKIEIASGKCAYVRTHFRQFLLGFVKLPCLLCRPQKFVTVGKALFVLVFVEMLGGMCLYLYILIRTLVSGYTYKLFTFRGWGDEVIDIMKIKKRVLTLDYPRFWTEEQLAAREAKKAAEEQEAKEEAKEFKDTGKDKVKDVAKDMAAAEAAKKLPVFAWPACGEFFSLFFDLFSDLFGDFALGFVVQLFAIGFATLIGEKAVEKHNSKEAVTYDQKSDPSEDSAEAAMDNVV